MSTTNIYRKESLLETKEFRGHFYIVRPLPNGEGLIWETDEEQEQSSQTGTIVIWLKGTPNGYELTLIPPDWHLQVNDIECEKGIYVDLLIKWHKVKLSYHEYAFEFLFDQQEYGDVPLPQPVSRQLPDRFSRDC